MATYTYALGELTLGIEWHDPTAGAYLDSLWRRTFQVRPLLTGPTPQALYTFAPAGCETIVCPTKAPTLTYGRFQVWVNGAGFVVQLGETRLALDLAQSRATGQWGDDFPAMSPNEQREFFRLTLYLLLRRHGHFGLHANGLAWSDQGALVAATSGSGKTTFTLSLLQAGWRYVADDAVLLAQQDAQVVAQGLRRDCSCTPETLARFPHLQVAIGDAAPLARDKQVVHLGALYSQHYTAHCTPRLLLFPQIGATPHTVLTPMTPLAALTALIAHSPGVLIDKRAVQQQMAVFKRLVQQARSYRVALGQDVFTAPDALSALLRQAFA